MRTGFSRRAPAFGRATRAAQAHDRVVQERVALREPRLVQRAGQISCRLWLGESPGDPLIDRQRRFTDVQSRVRQHHLKGQRCVGDAALLDQRYAQRAQAGAEHRLLAHAAEAERLAQAGGAFRGGGLLEHEHARAAHAESRGGYQPRQRAADHDGIPAPHTRRGPGRDLRETTHQSRGERGR
uniref:Uncharacterized protein n=1 Tax=uncultured bacterium W4-39b TaxID=1130994 RepID=H9BWR9_9BACT|nr:hypothetical protein [uncultured bacterium W4-39b]